MSILDDNSEFELLFSDLEEVGVVGAEDKLIARHFFEIGYLRGNTDCWKRRADMAIQRADKILATVRSA